MVNRECDPGEEVFVEMKWRRKDGQVTFERSGMEGAPDWVQEADRRLRGRLAERLGTYAVEGRGRSTPAEAQTQGGGEAVAWMRRWAFYKVGVMALPKKERPRGWNLLPVTPTNALDDDVPLYAAPPIAPVEVDAVRYDAGLLSPHGGGDVEWWQDYIRSELERAHDFYTEALAQQPAAVDGAMVERATMTLLGKSHDTAPGIDWRCDRAWTVNKVRKNMRAALTAALAAQPGGSDNDR